MIKQYQISIDFAYENDWTAGRLMNWLDENIRANGVKIIDLILKGPGGGCAELTVQGDKEAIIRIHELIGYDTSEDLFNTYAKAIE